MGRPLRARDPPDRELSPSRHIAAVRTSPPQNGKYATARARKSLAPAHEPSGSSRPAGGGIRPMGSVSTNASPARPFQAPRTRLRLEAAYGGRYWRAARCVPGTAIGPASKFRPDRCWRLLRPLKRGTHLASLARQLFRRARRSTGACPLRGLRSPYGLHSHGYAHRVSLVPPCAAFDEPTIIQDEPHAHSSPSATPCASPNTNRCAAFNPSGSRRIRADLAPDGFNTAPSLRA